MRKGINYILVLSFVLFGLFSCEEEKNNEIVQDFNHSGCKSSLKSNLNQEAIRVKTLDSGKLLIEHSDTYFNCEPGEITVDVKINNKTIEIYEDETSSLADCICPYDLEFKIIGIEYGENTFSIFHGNWEKDKFSINLTENTDTTIILN